MIVPADVYGADFLASYPDPQLLIDRGVRFVAIYLKNWRPDWVDQYRALGGFVVPIMEVTADRAAGGAPLGVKDALKGVQQAQTAGVPADRTVPIIYTQDSSAWSPVHVEYFKAAEPIDRAHGFLFGGYGGRKMFDDCTRAGVTWDVIWATNAWSWLGGRHPDRHVTQGGHGNVSIFNRTMWIGTNLDVSGMGNIDTNRSNRPFPAWGPDAITPPPPQPTTEEDEPMNIVTNKEIVYGFAPGVVKWLVRADGGLRHLDETEWVARGSEVGVFLTNAQVTAMTTAHP